MQSNKCSRLAQSHALLHTTTRALAPTPCTRKSRCQTKQKKMRNPSMERRLHLAASRWARAKKQENIIFEEGGNKRCLCRLPKYVQKLQRSQRVEDAGRQLCQVVKTETSESNKKCNRSNIQGWLNLMPRCTPPLELWLQLLALENLAAKLNKKKNEKSIHGAEALSSCISLGQSKETRKYQVRR